MLKECVVDTESLVPIFFLIVQPTRQLHQHATEEKVKPAETAQEAREGSTVEVGSWLNEGAPGGGRPVHLNNAYLHISPGYWDLQKGAVIIGRPMVELGGFE